MAKAPRWANEDWISTGPDLEKIECKDCAYRAEDRKYKGKIVTYGAELDTCDVFGNGTKPIDILLKNAECPYYLSQYDEGPDGEKEE